MKTLLLFLLLCSPCFGQAVWKGRTYYSVQCSNPNCQMCYGPNGIAAQLQTRYTTPHTPRITAPTPQPAPTFTTYATKVPYTTQVCIGKDRFGRCIFQTQTHYRTVTKTVPTPTSPPTAPTSTSHTPTGDPQAPTPYEVLSELPPLFPRGVTVHEFGSGDGRVARLLAAINNNTVIAIEKDPELASLSTALAKAQDLPVHTFNADIFDTDLSLPTHVYMHLYPDLMERILPSLQSGCLVVSYNHKISGSTQHGDFYVWKKP